MPFCYIKVLKINNINNKDMIYKDNKITEIFYLIDEFCIEFEESIKKHLLGNPAKKAPKMSCSEVITIMVLFHTSGHRTFKHFYTYYVQVHLTHLFPKTVSYNRFVELMQAATLPMAVFMKTCCLGTCTGISFIDVTAIKVCHNKRNSRNKVFKGIAKIGKTSMGYFFGFKLHLVINDKGELLNFLISQGNCSDQIALKNENFLKLIKGKLYGDKGYINKKLTELLFVDGIHLITHIRNNMKNVLMSMSDKIMLRKRALIETVNDELKNICQIEHSRHRSFTNFLSNLIAGLIAYSFLPKKPAIKYQNNSNFNQLTLF